MSALRILWFSRFFRSGFAGIIRVISHPHFPRQNRFRSISAAHLSSKLYLGGFSHGT